MAYRDSARKAMDFILNMQYSSGGFPQVYPARTGTSYSNHLTFNDWGGSYGTSLFAYTNTVGY